MEGPQLKIVDLAAVELGENAQQPREEGVGVAHSEGYAHGLVHRLPVKIATSVLPTVLP